MYQDRERDHGRLLEPAPDVTSDEQEEPAKTRFSSARPFPPVENAAGPMGPAGATASDRAYGTAAEERADGMEMVGGGLVMTETATADGASAEPVPEQPAAEAEWVVSARMYNDHHEAQVAEFEQRTDGACLGADGQLDPNLVADWQTQHGLAADGRVSPETVNATKSWLTPGWGATSASASSEDDAETMHKLEEAADDYTQLLNSTNLS